MHRQILAYIPANLVPALVSFATIYACTHLLTPEMYGDYSLAFSTVLVLQASLFFPLRIGVLRFFPKAERDKALPSLLKASYTSVTVLGFGIMLCGVPAWLAAPLPRDLWIAFGLAIALLLLRGAVTLAQSIHRMRSHTSRYNVIECTQAVLGLSVGLGLITWQGPSAAAVMGGLVVGSLVCALSDLKLALDCVRGARLDRAPVVALFRFGLPLALVFSTSFVLQYADRFVVGGLGGTAMLGVYAAAYSLVERPTTLLCTSVSTATFPMAVRAFECSGPEAARDQTARNGAVLLALCVPACLGLALSAGPIAAVLVGPEYRAGVAGLIPIMAATALLRGASTHFVDQAFHLVRRPDALFRIYAPAALANVVLDIAVVPPFGVLGAAWVALFCQAAAIVAGWILARRLFALSLPIAQLGGIAAGAGAMSGVLSVVHFPQTPPGLVLTIGTGALVYGAVLLGLQTRRAFDLIRRWPALRLGPG